MNTQEMTAEYEVIGFMAPFVAVRRRSDGVEGTMMFNHGTPDNPRMYTNFEEAS
jgi:hypothetical protein